MTYLAASNDCIRDLMTTLVGVHGEKSRRMHRSEVPAVSGLSRRMLWFTATALITYAPEEKEKGKDCQMNLHKLPGMLLSVQH